MHEIVAWWRIIIWDWSVPRIKKLKITDPHFFQKKLGSVFFNFLIRALLRPQIAIRQRVFYAYEKYIFGKSRNIHNSAYIGPFSEFKVSMETSLQEDSGLYIVTELIWPNKSGWFKNLVYFVKSYQSKWKEWQKVKSDKYSRRKQPPRIYYEISRTASHMFSLPVCYYQLTDWCVTMNYACMGN